ncbi:MAG: 50S ribosomal protein L10 [Microgenomates bacterium 39_6]|nr:MAG: 50S ribosomal protein L10 [Microgenomates bacterium 39_6]
MVKQEKLYEVDDLKARINKAKSFFLVGYQGWDANFFNLLRQEVAREGGELRVVRNSLFGRAVKDLIDQNEPIVGPSVCLFNLTDEVTPLSSLCSFLEDKGLEADLKLGFLTKTGKCLDRQESLRLAGLPSAQELRAMLVQRLSANLGRLTISLNNPIQKFAFIIKALQDKQGGEE